MRFRLLLEAPINSVPKANDLTALIDDDQELAIKQPIALKAMTDLNIRNCQITYLSQQVRDNKHPIFNLIYLLSTEFADNTQVIQIYKNFDDIKDIKNPEFFKNVIKVLESIKDVQSDWIKKLENILVDIEFYQRNAKDFEYTFKLLSVLISPAKLKQYFKDTKVVNFEELMINGHLKPAGINPLDESNNTLFGTVRSWTNGRSGAASQLSDKELTNNQKSDSSKNYFVSFEEVTSDYKNPKPGDIIKINGEFEYNPSYKADDAQHWQPVELYR